MIRRARLSVPLALLSRPEREQPASVMETKGETGSASSKLSASFFLAH